MVRLRVSLLVERAERPDFVRYVRNATRPGNIARAAQTKGIAAGSIPSVREASEHLESVRTDLFEHDAERALLQAARETLPDAARLAAAWDFRTLFDLLHTRLAEPIAAFFDNVILAMQVMEKAGLLERLVRSVLAAARSTGSLIAATLVTAFGSNVVTADQYISIALPGRLYRGEYEKRGLAPVNLSRALEDAGTLTSPLVPWNSCGAYMAATLGVATWSYLPYALFNLINPILALVFALAGIKILRLAADQVREAGRV